MGIMPTSKTMNLTSKKNSKKVRSKKVGKKGTKVLASKKTIATPAVVAPAVVAPAVVVPAVVSPVSVAPVVTDSCEINFDTIWTSLTMVMTQIKSLKGDIKTLEKNYKKKVKELSKGRSKKKNDDPNKPKRAPSGFAKPAIISDDLCDFLSKDHGTEMARTEVTKHLTQYIKNHSLQNPANRKEIKPDTALKSILGPLED